MHLSQIMFRQPLCKNGSVGVRPRILWRFKSWLEADHPRSDDGKFGAGGSHDKKRPDAEGLSGGVAGKIKLASARAKRSVAAVKAYLDRHTNQPGVRHAKATLGKALDAVKATQGRLYGVMEKRYGKAGARAIFVAAQAIGANPVVMPAWFVAIPGSTILAQLPLMGLAEVGLQAARAARAGVNAVKKSNEIDINKEAKGIIEELFAEFFKNVEPAQKELRMAFGILRKKSYADRTKDSGFRESDHPRANDGKFSATAGGGRSAWKNHADQFSDEEIDDDAEISDEDRKRIEMVLGFDPDSLWSGD